MTSGERKGDDAIGVWLPPTRRRIAPMCSPDPAFYPLLARLLAPLVGLPHRASLTAVTDLVWALLAAQSLRPAELVRALPQLRAAGARQGFRRVRRRLERPTCQSQRLTPALVAAGLRIVDDAVVGLVLDSSRCRRWEVLTLGIRFHGGRVLPVAWAVLPYPWPRRQFTPTVIALLDRVLTSWPADRPVHLVADRGFPSYALVRRLDEWRQRRPLGYTIRLRAGDWVRLDGAQAAKIAELLATVGEGRWRTWRAAYRRQAQASTPATLVIGRGLAVYPPQQRGPADQRRRQARAARPAHHRRSKGYRAPASADRAWALLSTEPTWRAAMTHYSGRFSTEGADRDWKSWAWEAVAGRAATADQADGITGVAALGAIIQSLLGAAAGCTRATAAQARQRQWTTTDRLSCFSRGRLVLHDRAHAWLPWLGQVMPDLADRLLGLAPAHPAEPPTLLPQRPAHKEAA
jgi:hypothetical protein